MRLGKPGDRRRVDAGTASHPDAVAELLQGGGDVRARSRVYPQTVTGEQTQRAGREELNYTVQRGGSTQGVLLFEGTPVEAAPHLGLVSVGGKNLPLFGVEVDMAGIQDARCPLFPDSLAQ